MQKAIDKFKNDYLSGGDCLWLPVMHLHQCVLYASVSLLILGACKVKVHIYTTDAIYRSV